MLDVQNHALILKDSKGLKIQRLHGSERVVPHPICADFGVSITLSEQFLDCKTYPAGRY